MILQITKSKERRSYQTTCDMPECHRVKGPDNDWLMARRASTIRRGIYEIEIQPLNERTAYRYGWSAICSCDCLHAFVSQELGALKVTA